MWEQQPPWQQPIRWPHTHHLCCIHLQQLHPQLNLQQQQQLLSSCRHKLMYWRHLHSSCLLPNLLWKHRKFSRQKEHQVLLGWCLLALNSILMWVSPPPGLASRQQ